MTCPKCGGPAVELFTSVACERCDNACACGSRETEPFSWEVVDMANFTVTVKTGRHCLACGAVWT